MAISVPMSSGIVDPPRDGKGNYLSQKDGKFVSTDDKPSVSVDALNQATKNGLDTRALIEAGSLEALVTDTGDVESTRKIKQANTPNTGTIPISKPRRENVSTDQVYNNRVNDASRTFGQQLWNLKVNLYNHSQPVYQLNPHAVQSLVIEDDLLSWPIKGFIVIDNRSESFERGSNDDSYFHIRADGRDEIFMDIFPIEKEDKLNDAIWRIKIHASIYDVEDMPHDDITNKRKKLYFWDKKYHQMQERTIQWSTATGTRSYKAGKKEWFKSKLIPKPVAHARDSERALYTGEAIASLLIDAGFKDDIDFDNWDYGASKINYTAKANWTIYQNIEYMLTQHVSEESLDQPLCGLGYNRATEKFTLIPRWKAYEESTDLNTNTGKSIEPGKLQLEHLFFMNRSANEDGTASPWKAPLLTNSEDEFSRDIKSAGYNTILSYQFSQTSGLDSSKAILTKPVYSHQHKGKQFQVDVQENEITQVKDYFKTQYVDRLLGNSYPVMVVNKTKQEALSIDPIFSPVSTLDPFEDRRARSEKGRGSVLFAGVYLNQCLSVRLPGSSHRLAGSFVGIDRFKEGSDTDYDYQVCGQYFVVTVSHIFDGDSYVNELTLVKVHAFDELKNNEDVY